MCGCASLRLTSNTITFIFPGPNQVSAQVPSICWCVRDRLPCTIPYHRNRNSRPQTPKTEKHVASIGWIGAQENATRTGTDDQNPNTAGSPGESASESYSEEICSAWNFLCPTFHGNEYYTSRALRNAS